MEKRPFFRPGFLSGALLAASSFVLLFSTRAAAQYGDSLNYLWAAFTGRGLFHPHHIIFNFVVREMLLLSRALGLGLTPLDVAQLHNILWAVVAVVSVYAIGLRVFNSRLWPILAALGLLVSQGFWEYATQAQSYAPAAGCLALLVFILVRKPVDHFRARDWALIALLLAVAVLYHQGDILFVLPLAVFILASAVRRGWRPLLATAVLSGAFVLAAYATALVSSGGERTVSGFIRFVFSYAYHPA
ncbi:MAG: glycosyltransferase family 39 protein, partial [Candidatus Aminicenantales bacterium]